VLKQQYREAQQLITQLSLRVHTLQKIVEAIVMYQSDFLEKGVEALKPLILNDIAAKIPCHGSTGSRVVSSKYLHTPLGVYPLKYFFSKSTAIRERIRKMILAENPQKPLSDNALSHALAQAGIVVERRTVAKYRGQLALPASHARKEEKI
jgi:RNA polymerase sigma-54 factor